LPALARAQAVQAKVERTAGVEQTTGEQRSAGVEPSSESEPPTESGHPGHPDDSGDRADLAIAFDRASEDATAVRQAHDLETRSRAIGLLLWQAVGQAASWDVDAETALRETVARFLATCEGATA
jgi:hypothetical protein